ncbi:MAG: S8 family serine peptidase [Candidatus Omnitrophica bacterium]|nr:S8 family serine peptidase [Candidatus Omnitrophota bacterium]
MKSIGRRAFFQSEECPQWKPWIENPGIIVWKRFQKKAVEALIFICYGLRLHGVVIARMGITMKQKTCGILLLVFLGALWLLSAADLEAAEQEQVVFKQANFAATPASETARYVPNEILVGLTDSSGIDEVLSGMGISIESAARVHDIQPAVANFRKDYKLEKSSDGWYWFFDKQYKEISDVPDEEMFKQVYATMPELEQKLYRSFKVKLPAGASVEETIAQLKRNPGVEYVEPNYLARTFYIPTDPYYGDYQWSHKKTQAEQGWDMQRGNSTIVIAIIDTGVKYTHEDLSTKIWRDGQNHPGKDFVNIATQDWIAAGYQLVTGEDYTTVDFDPSDKDGHGTHCAGIAGAAASNGRGVAGVCHNCKIMPLRAGFSIIDPEGYPAGSLDEYAIAQAIQFAADNGAHVISMSFGSSDDMTLVSDAIAYAASKNKVLVAASGNEGSNLTIYPAAYPNVIAVGATDINDVITTYSSFGSWVDIAAPGGGATTADDWILSTFIEDPDYPGYPEYQFGVGTSMACPYVAGVAGLILSENPALSAGGVSSILTSSSDDKGTVGKDNYYGYGRVNVYKAMLAARESKVMYGDVSEDAVVNAYDAARTAQYAVGLITLTTQQRQKAEVSADGSIDAYDAALIARYTVGLITKFPIQG